MLNIKENTIKSAVLKRIEESPDNEIFFLGDFAELGSVETIRKIFVQARKKLLNISSRLCNRTTAVASDKTDKRMIELPKKLVAEYEFIEGKRAKVRP